MEFPMASNVGEVSLQDHVLPLVEGPSSQNIVEDFRYATPPQVTTTDPFNSSSFVASAIVTLVVGPNQIVYTIHKKLLSEMPLLQFSSFAEDIRLGKYVIELPDADCMAVDAFAKYLYSEDPAWTWPKTDEDIHKLLHAWKFAEDENLLHLKDELMHAVLLYWQFDTSIHPTFFAWAIQNLDPHSLLYGAIRDQLVYALAAEEEKEYQGVYVQAYRDLRDLYTDETDEVFWEAMDVARAFGTEIRSPLDRVEEYYEVPRSRQ